MLQTVFYDTTRFRSEEEASQEKELYTVSYEYPIMVVTDPDGVKESLNLFHAPLMGLDVIDQMTLEGYLNEDMKHRYGCGIY